MGIDIIDESGKPRSDADIQEAIDLLTKIMVTSRMTADPELVVMVPTLLDLLREMQSIRKMIQKKLPNYGR